MFSDRQYKGVPDLNLKTLVIYELKSVLGRFFMNSKPKLRSENNYLNLGCGDCIIPGYVNADFYYKFKFWYKYQEKDWQLDLRYPLNCEDNTFDGIFTEHTLEHLYPQQVKKLLRELYRVLKEKSVIRITVPDIEKYVGYYMRNIEYIDKFDRMYGSGCFAIRCVTQGAYHLSVWDYDELKYYLEDVGFKQITKMAYGKSSDSRLLLDNKERAWETLYIEAIK